MNFLSIEYFVEIAKSGNISNTARELYISQQTLSEHISKLESELGTALFKRSRPMQLTIAGQRFLEGAQEMLAIREKTVQDIQNIVNSRQTKIFVGEASSFNPPFMSALVKKFVAEYPYYEIVVRSINVEDISGDSDTDLFFLDMPGDPSLENIPITDSDLHMVVVQQQMLDDIYGESWPDIEQRLLETKNLYLLKELPYIMMRDRQSRNSPALERAFEHAGFRPKTVFSSERNGLNIEMCFSGIGAFFGPLWLCKTFIGTRPEPKNDLRMFPISIRNCPAIGLGLGYHKNKKLNTVDRQFIEMTKSFLTELLA